MIKYTISSILLSDTGTSGTFNEGVLLFNRDVAAKSVTLYLLAEPYLFGVFKSQPLCNKSYPLNEIFVIYAKRNIIR